MATTKTTNEPNFAPQDVFSHVQHASAAFTAAAREQLDRFVEAMTQVDAWQKEGLQRAREATDEVARLTKATLDYGLQIAEHARAASIDAARRTLDLAAPKA